MMADPVAAQVCGAPPFGTIARSVGKAIPQ